MSGPSGLPYSSTIVYPPSPPSTPGRWATPRRAYRISSAPPSSTMPVSPRSPGFKWDGEIWYGKPGDGDFLGFKHQPQGAAVGGAGTHVALDDPCREAVRVFHAAALAAGGTDYGAPGLREFGEHYYAAFVQDPDGWRIEAVYEEPLERHEHA
ncbi:hypothetical protein BDK51DRAFT_29169 [Blyttiomyces helicus]|uniref:VOC domain-containing protein n=1 Tax=Blyttiomyces helicus TaxID=388810 RepID=A0A4P9WBA0_9FUNG|nr:hypothetical protein BDK51DRAFT_29169 [Blyttiomyces helicus]|eukprot:RKO89754.1 hypothetical protein BDK51DRAFT_29169 [Blyttiomyces helicus]